MPTKIENSTAMIVVRFSDTWLDLVTRDIIIVVRFSASNRLPRIVYHFVLKYVYEKIHSSGKGVKYC